LIAGMTLAVFTKTLAMVFVYITILGIGMGASLVVAANIYPVYFGKTHYPRIMGYVRPFTIIGSLGSPLSGWIRDITGHYTLAWQISVVIFAAALIFLILARPPVHPTLRKGKEVEPAQMPERQ
jgi:MFS family permease